MNVTTAGYKTAKPQVTLGYIIVVICFSIFFSRYHSVDLFDLIISRVALKPKKMEHP